MMRFVLLSAMLVCASAGNYGSNYGSGYGSNYGTGYGSGYGGQGYVAKLVTGNSGYGQGVTYGKVVGVATQGGYSGGQTVNAAVQSKHSMQFYDVPSTYSAPSPVTVEVPTGNQPLNFVFRSQSSPIQVDSHHESSPGSYKETQSQDEPHVSVHTVTRPVVQELREVITPFRRIKQEVQPVQEEVQTLVARGTGNSYAASDYGTGATYGSGSNYGSGATYGSGSNYGNAGLVLTTADLGSNYGNAGYTTGYASGYPTASYSSGYGKNY